MREMQKTVRGNPPEINDSAALSAIDSRGRRMQRPGIRKQPTKTLRRVKTEATRRRGSIGVAMVA